MSPAIQQRCWNHADREASCRCPRCGRSFCRECVTEHEWLLLCAACLRTAAGDGAPRGGVFRRLLPAAMALAGLLLAWLVFYGVSQAFLESATRQEGRVSRRGSGGEARAGAGRVFGAAPAPDRRRPA